MKTKTSNSIGCILSGILTLGINSALAENCSVSATGVAFGSYDRLSNTPLDGTGNVQVTCSLGLLELGADVDYDIYLSTGSSGSYFPRQMTTGSSTLDYNLYTNSSHSTIWGDGNGDTAIVNDMYELGGLLGDSETRNYPIYGRVPTAQNPAVDTYTDNITVTVQY